MQQALIRTARCRFHSLKTLTVRLLSSNNKSQQKLMQHETVDTKNRHTQNTHIGKWIVDTLQSQARLENSIRQCENAIRESLPKNSALKEALDFMNTVKTEEELRFVWYNRVLKQISTDEQMIFFREHMLSRGLVDRESFLFVFQEQGHVGNVETLLEVQEDMKSRGFEMDGALFDKLIQAYIVSKKFDRKFESLADVVKEMECLNVEPQLSTWNRIARHFVHNFKTIEAHEVLKDLRRRGFIGNGETDSVQAGLFEQLMKRLRNLATGDAALSNALENMRQVEGQVLMSEDIDKARLYNKVLSALVKMGKVSEAQIFFERMKLIGVKLNQNSFELLLEGLKSDPTKNSADIEELKHEMTFRGYLSSKPSEKDF